MENNHHLFSYARYLSCLSITAKYLGFPGESRGQGMARLQSLGHCIPLPLEVPYVRYCSHVHSRSRVCAAGNGFPTSACPLGGLPQKWVTPESSLPSGLRVQLGLELIASDEEWRPLCPRKEISSVFSDMEFSRNTLGGLDWHGRLQFRSDFIFPKCLQWDLYREL